MAKELRVAIDSVPIGGMKQVEDGDAKALFVRDSDGVRAFQAKCPHYGAPLAKGEICGGTLYCPWHKAAFSVADGALREPPALERLERYPVRVDGAEAVATLDAPMPVENAPKRGGDRHVLIVGTGAAAVAAVTTLRTSGFAGRITMIGREGGEPYDRPKLSKNFLAKETEPSAVSLDDGFFAKHEVDLVRGEATRIDPGRRTVEVDGRSIAADMMMVATGSSARMPNIEGRQLEGVHTLRSLDDAVVLSRAAGGAKAITIVGGGFIGIEAAAFLTKRGLKAMVVSPEPLPYANRFGDAVASALKRYHEGNGISFRDGEVVRIEGDGGVAAVVLKDGTRLPTNLVLIGLGAVPETAAIVGVPKREDGGIAVAEDLSVAPQVWAAGDIAAFPEHRSGTLARVEHWRLAEQHGVHVAQAMLGSKAPFRAAPFFWSNQGDKRLDYVGYAPEWDRIVTKGEPDDLDFISYYVKDGVVLASCSIGRNSEAIAFLDRLGGGSAPTVGDLA